MSKALTAAASEPGPLMITDLIRRVIGSPADRLIKKMQPNVVRINGLESRYKPMSDEDLRACTADFKQRIENGQPLDELLPEAFAVVREAGRRTMEMRHFDVQLIGGQVLHKGMVAEMRTGEGKTLVATLPVYLNALAGKGVHVVTVNDYLANRDAEWMGRIYRALGLTVGTVLSAVRDEASKRAGYACDITYGTNNEYGFDYLRDNMKFSIEQYVQRGHHFAIVDEVDSILIDEARTPLIISGPTDDTVDKYELIDSVIGVLQKELDFVVDEKQRQVSLTDEGVDKLEARLGIDNMYDPHNMEVLHHVNQALKAHYLFKRDKDYVVQPDPRSGDGKLKVVIVDEHTGRLMYGRRWSDGLHQSVEAKERVAVEAESQTYATITFQNYFRMYGKLGGMTGTAETEAEEFAKIYNLEVIPIPTNQPVARNDQHDIVYKSQAEKFKKVMAELEDCHKRGQPVLVGTTSVEKSELVHRLLEKQGIPHEVLNAKQHDREALIIAQAGRRGAVTISTNMAGRGTDIKLGGDPEGLARLELIDRRANGEEFDGLWPRELEEAAKLKGAPPPGPDITHPEYLAVLAKHRAECEAERAEVLKVGGLHILGTERHESRRIDNQLRGRAGRQGDPGSSRFYLSLEDDLLRLFGSDRTVVWMERMGMKDDEAIEHRWVTSSIENAQKKVEGNNFNMRKNLLEYDDVMNLQRKAVYELRRRALTGDNIRGMMLESVRALVDDLIGEFVPPGAKHEDWDTPKLMARAREIFGVVWEETPEALREEARLELAERLLKSATAAYEAKEVEIGAETLHLAERQVLLQLADQFWKDHLLAMDRLRDGVSLRGYGQKNPLLEYKKEGFHMFQLMQSLRDEAVVQRILRLDKDMADRFAAAARPRPRVTAEDIERQILMQRARAEAQAAQAAELESPPEFSPLPQAPQRAPARLPEKGAEARLFAFQAGLRRNDPCPCGSGQKYKKCCYDESAEPPAAAAFEPPAEPPFIAESSVGGEYSFGNGEDAETADEARPDELAGGGWMPDDVGVLGGEIEGGGSEPESDAGVTPKTPAATEDPPEESA
ncbi:protein translocase subunit SecA [Deltaproteobacteria bacterium]|nr:protein translocase subunit SecA [Deltaproteobacteria bacterium]